MGDKVKKIIIPIMLLSIFIVPMKVEAKTLNDFYNELAELEEKYNESSQNKKLTQDEINKINKELSDISSQITTTKNDIANAEKEIEKSYEEIEEKKNETNELMKFLQITSGGNVYLEYLFEAESYTDFIYRYSIVTQMSGYNNELMEELEELITNLENKKVELANKQTDLENQKKEFNDKVNYLNSNLENYVEEGATIEEEIKNVKKEIEHYEDLGCSRYQDVSTCYHTPTATGWSYPLSYGTVSDNYTGYAYERPNIGGYHHGIDLWHPNIYGAPVYPVAAGKIAIISWISGGGNAVYIYHTVNGKPYTTVYMHLSAYASGLYEGQEVTTNDVIGYVGNTGVSFGAHLHLGVATGNSVSGFNSRAFDPRNILWFPAMDSGVYFYR